MLFRKRVAVGRVAVAVTVIIIVVIAGVVGLYVFYKPAVSTHSTSVATTTGAPIKIGAFFDLSGPIATLGTQAADGEKYAVNQWNANGGVTIDGVRHLIDFTVLDAAGSTPQAVTDTQQLISAGNVAVVGGDNSNECLAVLSTYQSAGVPFITPVCAANTIYQQIGAQNLTYVFQASGTVVQFAQAMAATINYYLHPTRVAVVTLDETSTRLEASAFVQWFQQNAPGVSVVAQEFISATDTSGWSSAFLAAKQAGAQVIYFDVSGSTALEGAYISAWQTTQTPAVIANNSPYSPAGFSQYNQTLNTQIDDIRWVPTPADSAWVAGFQAQFNMPPNAIVAESYDAMNLTLTAIQQHGTWPLTGSSVRDGLEQVNFPGVWGQNKFDSMNSTTPHLKQFTFDIAQIVNGKLNLIWPTNIANSTFVSPVFPWGAKYNQTSAG